MDDEAPARSPDVHAADLDGSMVLLNARTRGLFPLNASAAIIWELCDGATSTGEIIDAVVELVGIDLAVARRDVLDALAKFDRVGLLEQIETLPQPASVATPATWAWSKDRGLVGVRCGPFRAPGLCFEIAVEDPELAATIDEMFDDLRDADGLPHLRLDVRRTSPGAWAIVVAGKEYWEGPQGDLFVGLLATVNFRLWHRYEPLMLHAATASRGEHAVVVTGSWGSGKSSVLAALLRAGYGYVADEASVIDPRTLVVESYHPPVSIDAAGWERVGLDLRQVRSWASGDQRLVRGDSIGPRGLTGSAKLAMAIVLARGVDDGSRLERWKPVQALVELWPCSWSVHSDPAGTFRALCRLTATVPVVRLSVDDPSRVAPAVDGLLTSLVR